MVKVSCLHKHSKPRSLKFLKAEIEKPYVVRLKLKNATLFEQLAIYFKKSSVSKTALRMSLLWPRIAEIKIDAVDRVGCELHTDHTVTIVHAAKKIIPNSRSCRNDDSMFFNDLNSIFCFFLLSLIISVTYYLASQMAPLFTAPPLLVSDLFTLRL